MDLCEETGRKQRRRTYDVNILLLSDSTKSRSGSRLRRKSETEHCRLLQSTSAYRTWIERREIGIRSNLQTSRCQFVQYSFLRVVALFNDDACGEVRESHAGIRAALANLHMRHLESFPASSSSYLQQRSQPACLSKTQTLMRNVLWTIRHARNG